MPAPVEFHFRNFAHWPLKALRTDCRILHWRIEKYFILIGWFVRIKRQSWTVVRFAADSSGTFLATAEFLNHSHLVIYRYKLKNVFFAKIANRKRANVQERKDFHPSNFDWTWYEPRLVILYQMIIVGTSCKMYMGLLNKKFLLWSRTPCFFF